MSKETIKRNRGASNQPASNEGDDLKAQNLPKTPEDVNPGGGEKTENTSGVKRKEREKVLDPSLELDKGKGIDLNSKKESTKENNTEIPSKKAKHKSSVTEKGPNLRPSASMQHPGKPPKPLPKNDGSEVESDLDACIKRMKKNTRELVNGGVTQLLESDVICRLTYQFVKDAVLHENQRSQLVVPNEGQQNLAFFIEETRNKAVEIVEGMITALVTSDDFLELSYDFLSDAIKTSFSESHKS